MNILMVLFLSFIARASFENHYFVNDCFIHNLEGKVELTLPGQYCYLLDDGSFVSHSMSEAKLLNARNEIQWKLPGIFHHQIYVSHDEKRVLLMGSDYSEIRGELIKDDRFMVVSRESGKVLHTARISELVPEDELLRLPIHENWITSRTPIRHEFSHFNSFTEIPRVKERPEVPWLKEGNFVVNSLVLGTLVLSPDLKKVLYKFRYERSSNHQVHDVKVLPSGNILLFNNVVKSGSHMHSAVEEVDPITLKPVFIFGHETGHPFFASHMSGADVVDDELLAVSLQWQGIYLVSRKTGAVVRSNQMVNVVNDTFRPNQNVRFRNLKGFLTSRK